MLETIIGVGFLSIILLVIAFQLEQKHQVIKVFSLFFAIFMILMLGKLSLDSKEVCEQRISSILTIGNTTTYNYQTQCYNQTTSTTPKTVYNTTLWYFRIAFLYVFGFIIWLVGTYLMRVNELRKAP
jgi:hypothetical protein